MIFAPHTKPAQTMDLSADLYEQLIGKYNVPAPRYTSYPSYPFWDQAPPDQNRWLHELRSKFSLKPIGQPVLAYTFTFRSAKVCALTVDVIHGLPKTIKLNPNTWIRS